MTDVEKRERRLDELEQELNAYAREIQERERAVQAVEREDITRTDYLFDVINQHRANYRPVVVEVPQSQPKTDSPLDCLTAICAMVSAVFTLTILVLLVM